jgi:hypothetical protein
VHEIFKGPGNWYMHYPSVYTSLVGVVPRVTAADAGCRVIRIPVNYSDGNFVALEYTQFLRSVSNERIVIVTIHDGGRKTLSFPASQYWICAKHLIGRKPDLSKSFTDDQKRAYDAYLIDSALSPYLIDSECPATEPPKLLTEKIGASGKPADEKTVTRIGLTTGNWSG